MTGARAHSTVWARRGLCVLLAVAMDEPGRAQGPTLHVQLAADTTHAGPAAWTRTRHDLLPRLAANITGDDPAAPLSLILDAHGIQRSTRPLDLDDFYLVAELRAGGKVVRIECDFDGLETWRGSTVPDTPTRLGTILALCGLGHHPGPLALDVAALAGRLSPGHDHGDYLPLLAAACETLVCAGITGPDDVFLRGRSVGGLLLPLMVAALADLRARPAPDGSFGGRAVSPPERWILLASCAIGSEREEAARQLSLIDDPAAREALGDLLHAPDLTRMVAMEAGLRRGDATRLPDLVAAASPDIALAEPLGEVALWRMMPEIATARQEEWLQRLTTHGSSRLRSFPDRWRSRQHPLAARIGGGHSGAANSSPPPVSPFSVVWFSAFALAVAVFVRRMAT